jgi:hypothetical protein
VDAEDPEAGVSEVFESLTTIEQVAVFNLQEFDEGSRW